MSSSSSQRSSEVNPRSEICSCCLNTDRNLKPLSLYLEIFLKIIKDKTKILSDMEDSNMLICWDCISTVHNVVHFRTKVGNANKFLHMAESRNTLNSNFVCKVCDVRLQSAVALERHSRQHYFKYTCDLCTYQCLRPTMMYDHFRREHSRKFECVKCGLCFINIRRFFKHYMAVHRKFVCDCCGKVCSKKSIIRSHIRRHHSKHRTTVQAGEHILSRPS